MNKIVQFIDENIPFVRDSYHQAIKDLSSNQIEVISYSYDQLKKNELDVHENEVVLFLEAGQLQPKHSGWNVDRFKRHFLILG